MSELEYHPVGLTPEDRRFLEAHWKGRPSPYVPILPLDAADGTGRALPTLGDSGMAGAEQADKPEP